MNFRGELGELAGEARERATEWRQSLFGIAPDILEALLETARVEAGQAQEAMSEILEAMPDIVAARDIKGVAPDFVKMPPRPRPSPPMMWRGVVVPAPDVHSQREAPSEQSVFWIIHPSGQPERELIPDVPSHPDPSYHYQIWWRGIVLSSSGDLYYASCKANNLGYHELETALSDHMEIGAQVTAEDFTLFDDVETLKNSLLRFVRVEGIAEHLQV